MIIDFTRASVRVSMIQGNDPQSKWRHGPKKYSVDPDSRLFETLVDMMNNGKKAVKLSDGNTYSIGAHYRWAKDTEPFYYMGGLTVDRIILTEVKP